MIPLKPNLASQPLTPSFDSLPIGSPERFIHGCWQLRLMRFHAFSHECREELRDTYNHINQGIGVQTVYVNLLSLGQNYQNEHQLLNIIRNSNQAYWIWFTNCEALLEMSFAGWLRSVLTTSDIEHIRVVFLLNSRDLYNNIFQRYSAPLYKATTALKIHQI